MKGQWQIQYRGLAAPDMPPHSQAMVRAYMESESAPPGLQSPEQAWPADVLFQGELKVTPGDNSREVVTLLATLNALEQQFGGLFVVVTDSLEMIGRADDGRYAISLDVDDEEEWDLGADDELDLDDEDEDEDLDWTPSVVFDGPDPGISPFDDGPLVAMGPGEEVASELHARSKSWVPEEFKVVKRPALDGQGHEYIVSGQIALLDGEVAHVVDADVALCSDAGEVLASETSILGFDVHRRGELWMSVSLPTPLSERVASIQVGLDSYYRSDHEIAHWTEDGDLDLVSPGNILVECQFRRIRWPLPALEVTGRFVNEAKSYLASMELTLEALDHTEEMVSDDDGQFGMTGPGESRPFRLQAPLGYDEVPDSAILRARAAFRRRELLCELMLVR